jgi:succinyl-diaminopimelate desuccinylase
MDLLLESVKTLQPEMVRFCSHLLQVPSVNGVHDEINVAEVIAEQARTLGLHVQIVGENPRRPNVIVSTAPNDQPTGLLLLAHIDTVPAGEERNWTYPPFSGAVADGRIYGRGAIDTKGGITAALYALYVLAQTPGSLAAGRVQLLCFPDEESGATGNLGVKYLHRSGLLGGLGAIYAYSGSQIVLGHRGLLRCRLICEGQTAHTGFLEWQDDKMGANAVTGMARLLLALESIESAYSTAKHFERFKTVITPGTMINGGVSINVVPDRCEALVDVRLTPEFDRERIEALIQQAIDEVTTRSGRRRFSYELLNYVPAAISDENAPIFNIVEQAVRLVNGITPERVVAGPANEGYLLIERGIPTVCGLGPSGENAHAANEYVEIQGLVDAAIIYCLTARGLSNRLINPNESAGHQ